MQRIVKHMSEHDKQYNTISYDEIIGHFGEDTIKDRFQYLYDKMTAYIAERGMEDALWINEDILRQAVMDYFADIYRLKVFHRIDRVNLIKISAYEVYWLLRRKPIQNKRMSGNDTKAVFSNEGFLTVFIAHECLGSNSKIPMTKEQADSYIDYLKHLNYCLKYRAIDKQWLETNLLSVEFGRSIGKS